MELLSFDTQQQSPNVVFICSFVYPTCPNLWSTGSHQSGCEHLRRHQPAVSVTMLGSSRCGTSMGWDALRSWLIRFLCGCCDYFVSGQCSEGILSFGDATHTQGLRESVGVCVADPSSVSKPRYLIAAGRLRIATGISVVKWRSKRNPANFQGWTLKTGRRPGTIHVSRT